MFSRGQKLCHDPNLSLNLYQPRIFPLIKGKLLIGNSDDDDSNLLIKFVMKTGVWFVCHNSFRYCISSCQLKLTQQSALASVNC